MNIFVLNNDPVLAARDLCEGHVHKMVTESAQLLQSCFSEERMAANDCPRTQFGTPRLNGNKNHPCAKWTRRSKQNMLWLFDHVEAMEAERFNRGSTKEHFSFSFVRWAKANINDAWVPDGPLTEYAIAINEDKKCRQDPRFHFGDAVLKYRLFYKHDKPFATWKKGPPAWFTEL